MDPPYSTHLDYGPDPRDIGKLDAADRAYYDAMDKVFDETHRILKPGGHMGLYVSDSYVHPGKFHPIGFELFWLLRRRFEPIDIISATRHNKTLEMGNYRKAAEEGNFFLRGFNYLFIARKQAVAATP
jgi:adenine-specific DNA-methyltransferase